jgi:hypothetical protein
LADDLEAERRTYDRLSSELYTTHLPQGVASRFAAPTQVADPQVQQAMDACAQRARSSARPSSGSVGGFGVNSSIRTWHLPSWMPRRYGWTEPLRHVYDPARTEHFWGQRDGLMFRSANRAATGEVDGRIGPWDILTKIRMWGQATRPELDSGIGAFLADCGRAMDMSYAMAHIFTDEQDDEYYRSWFELPPAEGVKAARQGPFPYFLRDLYWGNVFGPPYTELFGDERLRTVPAAVVTELREGYFYVQLTDAILDLCDADALPRYRAVRDAVKDHLGADCFYEAGATTPRRAPRWRTAVEDGLWKPREGVPLPDEVRALVAEIDQQ